MLYWLTELSRFPAYWLFTYVPSDRLTMSRKPIKLRSTDVARKQSRVERGEKGNWKENVHTMDDVALTTEA